MLKQKNSTIKYIKYSNKISTQIKYYRFYYGEQQNIVETVKTINQTSRSLRSFIHCFPNLSFRVLIYCPLESNYLFKSFSYLPGVTILNDWSFGILTNIRLTCKLNKSEESLINGIPDLLIFPTIEYTRMLDEMGKYNIPTLSILTQRSKKTNLINYQFYSHDEMFSYQFYLTFIERLFFSIIQEKVKLLNNV